ncbi:CP4A6 protein, partial [Crocuta crocuta]
QFQKGQELPELLKRAEKYPCASPRWLWGSKVTLAVYDPDYMKVVLGRSGCPSHILGSSQITCITLGRSFPTYPHYDPGYGLFLFNGQRRFQHCWMLTPAFHYDILKPYVGHVVDSACVMLELIKENSYLEIFEYVSLMILDIIMKCDFSYQGSHQADR